MMNLPNPRRTRRLALAASVAASVLFGLGTNASADVAAQIPADALFAVKINGLNDVNQNWSALAREWGLDQADATLADPLDNLKQQSGMTEGVDFDGEFAMYAPKDSDFDGDEAPFVLLVPVSNFDGFLGNFEDRREEGDLMVVTKDGQESYVKRAGDYAAVSSFAASLQAAGQLGLELGGPTGDDFGDRDVTLYANFATLGPVLKSAFEDNGGREKLLEEVEKAFEDGDIPEGFRQYRPVARAAAGQFYEVIESFLRDADSATVGIDFDPEIGVVSNIVAQFKSDTYLAGLTSELETSGSLLSGLPAGSYLLYGGSVADPRASVKLLDDLVGPVIRELEGLGDETGGLLKQLLDTVRTAVGASESSRFGLFAPDTSRIGQQAVVQQVQIIGGEPQTLFDATKKSAELTPQLLAAVSRQAGEEAPAANVTFEENAKEVAGVSWARSRTDLPQNDPMQAMFSNMIFGPEGQTAFLAVVEDAFVNVSGLSDAQITQVVEAIRAGDSPLDDKTGLTEINDKLPGDRSLVAYIDLGEIGRAGLGALQAFGQAPPVQIPQNLPPIGIGVGPDNDALRIGIVIHKDLVSAAVVTSLQLQGGPQGPNRGL